MTENVSPKTPNVTIEAITPEMAKLYLATSKGNRPISPAAVNRYSRDMADGNWSLNGMSIIFDNEGHLIDGHHRLKAIEKSGATVLTYVIRGNVDEGAFATIDDGKKRSGGHTITILGGENSALVSACIGVVENLKKNGKIYANTTTTGYCRRSNREISVLYQQDPEGYSKAAIFANKFSKKRFVSPSWISGLFYYLTRVGNYSEECVSVFFENVCSFSESEYVCIETLRKKILTATINHMRIDSETLFAFLAKTWNAYVEGRSLKALIYNPKGEYPKLKLNKQQ